jgi:cysteine-rich repeat protein
VQSSKFRRRATALLPLLTLASLSTPAHAAEELAIDTWDGTNTTVTHTPGNAPGSQITIASAVTISSIAVRVDLVGSGNLKFLIFRHPDHELVYVSDPEPFTDDGMSWKQSNILDVTLPPGTYEFGALADVVAYWQYDGSPASADGYFSTASNPSFSNYNSPAISSAHGNADGAVRLYVRIPECGDGFVDVTEECDDGNAEGGDGCAVDCTLEEDDGEGGSGSGDDDPGDDAPGDDDPGDDDPGDDDPGDDDPGDGGAGTGGSDDGGSGDGGSDDGVTGNGGSGNAGGKGGSGNAGGKGGSGNAGGKGGSGNAGGHEPRGEAGSDNAGDGASRDAGDTSGGGCRLRAPSGSSGGLWALLILGVLAGARRRTR